MLKLIYFTLCLFFLLVGIVIEKISMGEFGISLCLIYIGNSLKDK